MPPPLFNEITKRAFDVIYGGHNSDNFGKVLGAIELNKKCEKYGINLCSRWNTNGVIRAEVTSLPNFYKEGVKFAAKSSVALRTGYRRQSLRVESEYKNKILALNGAAEFKTAAPAVVTFSGLLTRRIRALEIAKNWKWFAGVQSEVDCTTQDYFEQNRCNLAFGLFVPDRALIAVLIKRKQHDILIHHRISKNLEYGVELQWLHEYERRKWAFGTKYTVNNRRTKFRLQTNSSDQFYFKLEQKISWGIDLSFSALFDERIYNDRNGQSPWRYGLGIRWVF